LDEACQLVRNTRDNEKVTSNAKLVDSFFYDETVKAPKTTLQLFNRGNKSPTLLACWARLQDLTVAAEQAADNEERMFPPTGLIVGLNGITLRGADGAQHTGLTRRQACVFLTTWTSRHWTPDMIGNYLKRPSAKMREELLAQNIFLERK
jgi:hypothetical protein